MLFSVTKNKVVLSEEEKVNEGEYKATLCQFEFDDVYTGLVIKAVFTNSSRGSYEVPILNDRCEIPAEVLQSMGNIKVGVYGYEVNGNELVLRYSPSPTFVKVDSGSYVSNPLNPEEITPTQFEQYMQAMNDGLEEVENVNIDATKEGHTATVTITNRDGQTKSVEILDGSKGEKGDKGDTGPRGATGPANTLSIGTVQGGDTAEATITGTAPNQTLNLTLPKGDKGDKGDTGPRGYTNVSAGNAIQIDTEDNNRISADIYPADFFIATDGVSGKGTTLTLNNTMAFELDSVDICGDMNQNGTPTPDTPVNVNTVTGEQTVNVRGVNMFNVNKTLENKYLDNSGGWATATYSYVNQEYIVTGSGELSFSFAKKNGSPVIRVGEYKTDGTFIRRTLVSTALTLTLDTLTDKIILSVDNVSPNYFDELQIELGSSPTPYQPYTSQSYTLDLGAIELCKIGDSQDYIYKSGDDWYVHKEINTKTIDGTESGWGKSGVSQNNAYYISTDIFNDMNRDGMGTDQYDTHITPTISRYFLATSSNDIFTTDAIGLGFNAHPEPSQSLDLRIGVGLSSSLNTVQLFKDWLALNPVTVYYALTTATDTKITDNALLGQLEALVKAQSYDWQTNIDVTASGTNLPAILSVNGYRKSLAGMAKAIKYLVSKAE